MEAGIKEADAIAIGFFVSCIPPAVLFAGLSPLNVDGPELVVIVGLFPVAFAGSLLSVIIFALPIFLLLRRSGLVRLPLALFTGFANGAIVSLCLQQFGFRIYPSPMGHILIFGLTGIFSALVFWLIWRWGNVRSRRSCDKQNGS